MVLLKVQQTTSQPVNYESCSPQTGLLQPLNFVFCILTTSAFLQLCLQSCTVCPANEYVAASPETCQPCPAMSSSSGGVVRVCPCMEGTGRVNESDPSLPCVGEFLACR